jgi:hypothetical protein
VVGGLSFICIPRKRLAPDQGCLVLARAVDDVPAEHRLALRRCASKEAEPLSHARMLSRRFCKKVVLAGFAAEAKAPMMMGNKTELAATVCAPILRLAHELAP